MPADHGCPDMMTLHVSIQPASGPAREQAFMVRRMVNLGSATRDAETAVALAEPLLLFLIAGFIGTIFIGMLLPVLTMSQNIK